MSLKNAPPKKTSDRQDTGDLLRFNRALDTCSGYALNECAIESKLAELQSLEAEGCLGWLTLARIGELALFCAGNYADAGEFQACGDLMFNPRRIAIHINGCRQPVIKPRHMNFSETLESNGLTPAMREAYLLAVEKPSLISTIFEQLKASSLFSDRYLQSVLNRMYRIADTVGFLSAYHCSNSCHFYRKLQQTSDAERRYILSRLCNFDLKTFHELGRDIQGLIASNRYRSRFLEPMMMDSPLIRPIDLNKYQYISPTHSATAETGIQ